MLPQVGSLEYLVIAIVALLVIGPKDLPLMLRKMGKFVGRLRGMANEFRASFDEMARQSELDDLRKEVAAMRETALSEKAAVDEHITAIDNTIHGGTTMIDGAPYNPAEPESYLRYPETQAEKIINRKKRVAEAEGPAARPKAKSKITSAKIKPPTVSSVAKPAAKAKAPAKPKAKP